MKSQKLYVLVRTDLPWSHRAVQAGHAVAEFMLTHEGAWENGTLVYLRVSDEASLGKYITHWGENYLQAGFWEPDLGDELTAIAALGVDELVKDLPLL